MQPLDRLLPLCYNLYMDDKERYAHIRVLRQTQKNVRLAAALAEKSSLDLLDELVQKELDRLQAERNKRHDEELYVPDFPQCND